MIQKKNPQRNPPHQRSGLTHCHFLKPFVQIKAVIRTHISNYLTFLSPLLYTAIIVQAPDSVIVACNRARLHSTLSMCEDVLVLFSLKWLANVATPVLVF